MSIYWEYTSVWFENHILEYSMINSILDYVDPKTEAFKTGGLMTQENRFIELPRPTVGS